MWNIMRSMVLLQALRGRAGLAGMMVLHPMMANQMLAGWLAGM